MIIQHNIMAINSHRQLGINNSNLSGNLEKLSSGYRINRAADDAAGLAISEKMRAQITGLNRAVLNAQDGASLIQTAEGALTEVHGMLNRMVELGTQAANGTIQADDRQKIEAELTALKGEIDRISEATNFNGIQLLDGSLGAQSFETLELTNLTRTTTTATNAAAVKNSFTAAAISAATATAGQSISYTVTLSDNTSQTVEFTISGDGKNMVAADGTEYTTASANAQALGEIASALASELNKTSGFGASFTAAGTSAGVMSFTAKEAGTGAPKVLSFSQTNTAGVTAAVSSTTTVAAADEAKGYTITAYDGTNAESAVFSVNGVKFAVATEANASKLQDDSVNLIITAGTDAVDYSAIAQQIAAKTGVDVTSTAPNSTTNVAELVFHESTGDGLTMQVGTSSAAFDKITVAVDNMSSTGLGIKDISMSSQESAAAALDKVNAAIEKVSVNRGNLGALQNRLDHTISNLNVTSENMTAAESRIRDVDMAKEMMDFTKNSVLAQAAQAMLAQANMQPQQVLQLLG